MHKFSDKKTTETVSLAFDFSRNLGDGEGISSASVSVVVLDGDDPDSGAILDGVPEIDGSLVTQKVTGGVNGVSYALSFTINTQSGHAYTEIGLLTVVDTLSLRSALFVRDIIVSVIRSNNMELAGDTYALLNKATDDQIWDKIQAAESDLANRLTVPLEPVEIFPSQPTQSEIDALGGRPYLIEPGYDLPPNFFGPENFGFLVLRQRPVIAVDEVKLIYPNQGGANFTIPPDWVRLDHKYGQLHLFPSAKTISVPLSLMTMQAIGGGYNIPYMIRVRYRAGLDKNNRHYKLVVDLVKRMAVLRLLNDAVLPQSSSLSVDGMSQSVSVDMGNLDKSTQADIGTLKDSLVGPVWGVL